MRRQPRPRRMEPGRRGLRGIVNRLRGVIMVSTALLGLAPVAAAAGPLVIATEKVNLFVETLAEGLDHPWAVEPLPDGGLLVTERSGHLRIFRDGKLSQVKGMPSVWAKVQGGLLDVALSKDFQKDGILFLT